MTKFLSIAMMTAATLASAGAIAQTAPKSAPTPPRPAPKPLVTTHATKTTRVVTTRSTQAPAAKPAGKMVTAKLANGKTVTYNCALKGNATKQACK